MPPSAGCLPRSAAKQDAPFLDHLERLEIHYKSQSVQWRIGPLIRSFAQRGFQLDVETAANLRHSLIAILAKGHLEQ